MKFFLQGKNRRAAVLGLAVFCLFIGGCTGVKTHEYSLTDTAMGTVVNFKVYGNESVKELPDVLYERVTALEKEVLSPDIEGSALAELNERATEDAGYMLDDILNRSLDLCEATGGALDISLGALTLLWGIDKDRDEPFRVPSEEEIAEALARTGFERIEKTEEGYILPEGMVLNLGAVGKGAALDLVAEELKEREDALTGAVVSLGGSVLTLGSKPDKSPWRIGVKDPADNTKLLGSLVLTGEWYVSTSGDYERVAEVDGVRYHHILDRNTGAPADSGVRSVTVLGKDGLVGDALSTACFVLGAERGMALAEELGQEVLFVDSEGKLHMSAGMQEFFER